MALIRLLYSGQKNNPDPKVQEERMNLLKECLNVLKMISISPDNHKPIVELGLLNFFEKLLAELAALAAAVGAGSASAWNSFQPKEPKRSAK